MPINTPPVQSQLPVTPQGAAWPKAWANWFNQAWAILAAVEQSGTTTNRPTTNLWTGRFYWDTTLGLPIFWNGSGWVDAAGNSV